MAGVVEIRSLRQRTESPRSAWATQQELEDEKRKKQDEIRRHEPEAGNNFAGERLQKVNWDW